MALAILELNDAGIRVSVNGEIVLNSPAYAVLHEDQLSIGVDGFRKVRLYPRWTNNKFWQQLNTNPMPNSTARIRHHADLAFAHLEHIWQQIRTDVDEVVLAVPGSFTADQLGLLLGIANECGLPVAGLVDSALATTIDQQPTSTALHLDIQLHNIVLSVIQHGEQVARTEVLSITELGLFTIMDRWANIIADLFIQNTRFDPMHEASTEQQLFNQLPDWIRDFPDHKASDFNLKFGDSSHSVSVSMEKLLAACANVYPQIVQQVRNRVQGQHQVRLYLSDRFQGFPGLENSLGLLRDCEVIRLTAGDLTTAVINHLDEIRSGADGLSYITAMAGTQDETGPGSLPRNLERATHLLHGHTAVSIGKLFKLAPDLSAGLRQSSSAPHCTLYFRGDQLMLHNHAPEGTLVNGNAVTEHAILQPGDSIQLADQNILVISAETVHGP